MNKDQVKGSIKQAAGKVQEKVGKVIGSPEQRIRGAIKVAEGRTQKVVGDVEELVKDVTRKP